MNQGKFHIYVYANKAAVKKMGPLENMHSSNEIIEPVNALSKYCIETVKEYMNGLSIEDRSDAERDICSDFFTKWTSSDQVFFTQKLLNKMQYQQMDQIREHMDLLLKRDFISLLDKQGMHHIIEDILSSFDAESLALIQLVSKKWFCVISESIVWKRCYEKNVQTDPMWMALFKRRNWFQYLFRLQPKIEKPPYSFYGKLYPKIKNDLQQLQHNWRYAKYTAKQIFSNSETRGVYCLQYDDMKIVSGQRDNTIKIWNCNDLMCIRILTGHTGSVLCLQFDENILISGSSDATIRIWDINAGTLLNTYIHHMQAVLHLRFDNDTMVTCSRDHTIAIWDLSETHELSLRRVLMGHNSAVNVIDFDEKYIVSASGDRRIKIWDTMNGTLLRTLRGHERGIACLQYRDGLIISGGSDNSIRIWDVETGECIRVLRGHTSLVRCLRFDSKRIVSGDYNGTIMVWDLVAALDPLTLDSKLCALVLKEHNARVFRLQFDEFQIVSSSHDDTIIIWNFLPPNSNDGAGHGSSSDAKSL